jgi:hypothetical protein
VGIMISDSHMDFSQNSKNVSTESQQLIMQENVLFSYLFIILFSFVRVTQKKKEKKRELLVFYFHQRNDLDILY